MVVTLSKHAFLVSFLGHSSGPLVVPFQSGGSSQSGFNTNTLIPVVLSATQNQGGHSGGRPQTTQLRPVSSGSGSFTGSLTSGNDNSLIPLVISATLNQHANKFTGNAQSGSSSSSQNNNNLIPLVITATQAAGSQGHQGHQGHSSSGSFSNSHTQAILPVLLSQQGQNQGGHGHSSHSQHQHNKGSGSFGGGYSANQIDDAFEFSQPQKSREVSSFTVKSQQRQSSSSQQHNQSSGQQQHPGGPYP